MREIALQEQQMFLLGAGTQSIRFRPVLDVEAADIALMLDKLGWCLARLREECESGKLVAGQAEESE